MTSSAEPALLRHLPAASRVALVLLVVDERWRALGGRRPARASSGAAPASRPRVAHLRALARPLDGLRPDRSTGYQFVEYAPWLPEYGIHWFVGIDGISLLLVAAHHLPDADRAASRRGTTSSSSLRSYVFFMLFLETGMLGAFVCAEPVPVLRVLGADAGPDVLHHRDLGRRRGASTRRSSSSCSRWSARC